jgi:hypothetical protein
MGCSCPLYLLFTNDIKIYWAVKSPQDCNLLQSDINWYLPSWCIANCMKLNISETKVISFSRKTNALTYGSAKLHLHDHVNYIFSHCIKLLDLVRSITFNFSCLESMHRLYIILVRSVEYASVVWNLITSTEDKQAGTHPAEVCGPLF